MLSRGMRYGAVVMATVIILIADVWFVQAPDTLKAYTDLFFLNTGTFPGYMLDSFNIQYMVAFILYLNLLEYCVLSEINESPSFISLMQYRCGNHKTFQMLMKMQVKELVLFTCLSIFTIVSVCCLKGGVDVLNMQDLLLLVLYAIRFMLVIVIFLIFYNSTSISGSSTKGLLTVSVGLIALLILDVISGLHCLTFAGVLFTELSLLCVTCAICIIMYRYSLWRVRREK